MTLDIPRKEAISPIQRVLWALNTIFHQAVAVVTVFIFWIYFTNCDLDSPLLWHVVLSTGAYLPLMAEGIIMFSGDNVWSLVKRRTHKYWIHALLLGISIVAVTVGIAMAIHHQSLRGTGHFISSHAKIGLVSWLFVLISLFLGTFSSHSQSLKNIARPVTFKFIHNIVGIFCYEIGIISLCTAFYLVDFTQFVGIAEQKALLGVVIIIGVWTVLSAIRSCCNQLTDIFR